MASSAKRVPRPSLTKQSQNILENLPLGLLRRRFDCARSTRSAQRDAARNDDKKEPASRFFFVA